MVNWKSRKLGDMLILANGIVLVILLNLLAAQFFFRLDLTEEKRHSIKDQTKEMLKNLEDDVFIEVYLEGELNSAFTRFKKSIGETLEEFRIYSGNRLTYTFTNPSQASGQKAQREFMADLAARGIQPTNVIENQGGQRVEKLIFPGAIVSYEGQETGVMLLKGNKAGTPEEEINQSIEGIEYELANAIHKLTESNRKKVAIVRGHGELDSLMDAGMMAAISELYDPVYLNPGDAPLTGYAAVIIAKPRKAFSEEDRLAIDQYIMGGGRAMFFLDRLEASMDSAGREHYFAFPLNTGLDDMLFRYGVRINMDLIQDRNAGFFPVVTGQSGSTPRIQALEWPFFPLVNRYAEHPITRNLDAVQFRFASSLDTVKATGVRKTPIVFSSQYARTMTAPVAVNINQFRQDIPLQEFGKSFIPMAYLLEGKFTSAFRNRLLPRDVPGFKQEGISKIIIVGDGDVVASQLNPRTGQPQALGFDPVTNYTYGNRDFLMNMLAFLTDENGIIAARNKQVKIRPLHRQKIEDERLKWQFINLVLPLALIILYGFTRAAIRRKKYASF